METDRPRAADPEPVPTPAAGGVGGEGGALRFALTIGAWFVGLFGLMRLGWVENTLLTPFAQLQQRVAEQLTGVTSGLLYADASCSGGDPMALCMGAVFAYPAAWGARLRGAAVGLAAITALNVVRLGSLSMVAEDRGLLDVLHLYVWPGILIVAAVVYVYGWMDRQGSRRGGPGRPPAAGAAPVGAPGAAPVGAPVGAPGAAPVGALGAALVLGGAARRFLVLTAALVAAYFAAAPFFYQSRLVYVLAGWVATAGGAVLTAGGTTATVHGAGIITAHGGFLVTQECVFTPLIPVYIAGVLAVPLVPWRRALALAATPVIFFAIGVARVLVLAVPAAFVGSYEVAIHGFSQTLVSVLLVAAAAVWTAGNGRPGAARALMAIGAGIAAGLAAAPVLGALYGGGGAGLQALAGHGHPFVDEQGAAAILPAFQVGLYAALWAAVAGLAEWRRALAGLGLLAAAQAALALPVGELAYHFSFDPHVSLIRALTVVVPVALVWTLARPAGAPVWRTGGTVQSATILASP